MCLYMGHTHTYSNTPAVWTTGATVYESDQQRKKLTHTGPPQPQLATNYVEAGPKLREGRGGKTLVKMSANWEVVGTWRTRTSPIATRSRMKCKSISTCFVRWCASHSRQTAPPVPLARARGLIRPLSPPDPLWGQNHHQQGPRLPHGPDPPARHTSPSRPCWGSWGTVARAASATTPSRCYGLVVAVVARDASPIAAAPAATRGGLSERGLITPATSPA
jgi:hypothetical protein